jgi:hypothetical protein
MLQTKIADGMHNKSIMSKVCYLLAMVSCVAVRAGVAGTANQLAAAAAAAAAARGCVMRGSVGNAGRSRNMASLPLVAVKQHVVM